MSESKDPLTHFDEAGAAVMVDVGDKAASERRALAEGKVYMQAETLARIKDGGVKKGDVLSVAQLAGIMGAKKTPDLIPLCHPLALSHVSVTLEPDDEASCLVIRAECRLRGKTGVEMEALTATSVAALTVYDMCKAMDKAMVLSEIRLIEKNSGKSGPYRAPD